MIHKIIIITQDTEVIHEWASGKTQQCNTINLQEK